jgi:tetratricopeptide (TPR) repeat protein
MDSTEFAAMMDEAGAPAAQAPVAAPQAELAVDDLGSDWAGAVELLVAEAAHLEGAARAAALAEAARLSRTRLGDLNLAEQHARAAIVADASSIIAARELTEVLNRTQRFGELREQLERLAALEPDARTASEILQDAAVLTRNHLQSDAQAMVLLRASADRHPEDWFTLQLLRDGQLAARDWDGLNETLRRMSALSSGPLAARLHHERGRVLAEGLRQPEQAVIAFRAALAAAPEHGSAFLALERLYVNAAEWESLVQLYLDEATRVSGADAAFWRARAARILRGRLYDEERAVAAYNEALDFGFDLGLVHELQAFYAELRRYEPLAAAIDQEIHHEEGAARAQAQLRLAALYEHQLGRGDAALPLYRDVLASDPRRRGRRRGHRPPAAPARRLRRALELLG